MSSGRIRVMLADDHRLVREALAILLQRECDVVGQAASGEDALDLAPRLRPDVLVLDVGMPGIGGLDAAARILKRSPSIKVLILSQYDDEEYVIQAFAAGAAGYLLKSDAPQELLDAVRAVHANKRYISPSIAPVVLNQMRQKGRSAAEIGLTRREREVLRLIAEGATSKEIAAKLNISPRTAQAHRDGIKEKLNLRSTAQMVRYAIKHKLIKLA